MSNFVVSVSPHIRAKDTTQSIMRDVLIALCPALVASVLIFGFQSLLVVATCAAFAVLGEWAFNKSVKKECTIGDLSAAVTGVILAFNLPVTIPLWQAAFGAIVAVVVVKGLFGGIGQNFANPAITARIVMFLAFSQSMTAWTFPDAVSTATPLAVLASGELAAMPSLTNMFLGIKGGCLGETSALALIIGGVYLLCRKVITWHAPVGFIGTVFVFTAILGQNPVYHILSGGLMLGAIFMATDYVTTPPTKIGRLIFGIGCGFITVVIRMWGNYPEGVSFAILLMNIITPYITKWTMSKPLGGVKA